MQAEKLNFSRIFQIEGITEHYHIPKYQREYTWGKYNWEVLIQDIEENDPGYFVGSIIVVSDQSELRAGEEKVYQVIDGQQRLTTLSLLLAAVYKRYQELKEEDELDEFEAEDYTVKLNSLRKKIIKTKKEFYENENGGFKEEKLMHFLRVQPSSQNNNLNDYKYILSSIGLLKNVPIPKHYGNRLFAKAYRYFYNSLPRSKDGLDHLVEKINSLVFIHISVGTQADAFTLFETLNNRGVPLSPIDIIKNSLLSEMEKQHRQDIDTSYDNWQQLLHYIPDFDNQLRFLRQYYNAFKVNENIKQERISRATRSNILHIYEKLIKKNAQTTFNELLEKGELYGRLIDRVELESSQVAFLLTELNRVGAAASYTTLLYLLANRTSLENNNSLAEIISFLIKYYVRRNVTDYPNTRDLDAINIEVVEFCHAQLQSGGKISQQTIVDAHFNNTRATPSAIQDFRKALADDMFLNNVGMTRYLLWKLDSLTHNREYSPDLWMRNPNNNTYIWTIEHVLPQGKNLPAAWIDMISAGNEEMAEQVQTDWVHKLGNLTLSAYNSNLSNKSFFEKQEKSQRNVLNEKLYIGYKNGLALNKLGFPCNGTMTSLDTTGSWTEEMIEARTQSMVEKLVEIFKFEEE